MTNKDAKLWFEGVYLSIKGKGYEDENEEAYEKAISALEKVDTLEEISEELAAENDMLREREKAILDYLKENADDFPDYHEAIEFIVGLRNV